MEMPFFRTTYHCARSSEWGDRLPVELEKEVRVKAKKEEQVFKDEKEEEAETERKE